MKKFFETQLKEVSENGSREKKWNKTERIFKWKLKEMCGRKLKEIFEKILQFLRDGKSRL